MAIEFMAGFSAFNTIIDSVKGLKEINDVAIRNSTIIDIQEKIMSAQQQYASLHQEYLSALQNVSDLEKKVACFETWKREKERYELHKVGHGIFLYRLKESETGVEPPHDICARCYEDDKKSILQFHDDIRGKMTFKCPVCDFTYSVGESSPLKIQRTPPEGWTG